MWGKKEISRDTILSYFLHFIFSLNVFSFYFDDNIDNSGSDVAPSTWRPLPPYNFDDGSHSNTTRTNIDSNRVSSNTGNNGSFEADAEFGDANFNYADSHINFSPNIKSHIAKVDGFNQKKGVVGGHNQNSFDQIAKEKNLKVVDEKFDPKNPGVKKVTYKIPSYDTTGNVTGYKNANYTKTVYDPEFFSDERIYALGRQASNKITSNDIASGKPYFDKISEGLKFRIYVRDGKVTNFHPQLD